VFGLVALAAAIVEAGLLGYFSWRAKLQRRIWVMPTTNGALRSQQSLLETKALIESEEWCGMFNQGRAVPILGRHSDVPVGKLEEWRTNVDKERAMDHAVADSFQRGIRRRGRSG